MPRPKPINYNPPADLLTRLPGKPIITLGDKLAALNTMFHRCEIGWRDLHLSIINAIREDIRLSAWRKRETQRDSAPVRPEAPSRPEQRSEVGGSSIPDRELERKIADNVVAAIDPLGSINLYAHGETLICFTPDQAERAAAALTELAGDLRQDANARAWSQDLLNTTG